MTHRTKVGVAVLAASLAATATGIAVGASGGEDRSASLVRQIDASKPKNVILLVGDGMGDSEITLARYYGKGAAGRFNMDALPFRGSSIHYVLTPGPGPSYKPNYTGDSAPTAVAWSTGKRTIDGRLAQGPSSAETVPGSNDGYKTYMEIAREQGKATGNVTTAELTDATPAGPTAHISQRKCQGPGDTRTYCSSEAKSAGGLGSVAEQTVDAQYDVALGGGKARFEQTLDDNSGDVLKYAKAKGITQQVTDKAGLDGISSLRGGKVLGLFNGSNMTTEFKALYARPQSWYEANPNRDINEFGGSDTTKCDEGQRAATNEPSLAEMTQKAIDLLKDDPQGFTLQVEGASIDKRNHAADVCGQIGETLALDKAIGVAQEFQRSHPDTLIVVTADHAHTSQIGYTHGLPAPGASFATLSTVDDAPIRVIYGTDDTTRTKNGKPDYSTMHTGAQVPVWASGPQAANVQGTIDQTDIFGILNGKAPSDMPGGSTVTVPGPVTTVTTPGTTVTRPTPVPGPKPRVSCSKPKGRVMRCNVRALMAARGSMARLVKSRRTVARGRVRGGRVTFRARRKLGKGTYTVVAAGSARVRVR